MSVRGSTAGDPPPPPSPPPCTKMTSMITIFDHALAHGYEPRRQRSTLAKAEGVRELEEKRKNEDKVVLMLTQGEKKKKNRRSNKATSATGSLFPPTPPVSYLQNFAAFPLFFPPFFIPARESSPRLLLVKPNYSGRHCLPDRKTDGQTDGWRDRRTCTSLPTD